MTTLSGRAVAPRSGQPPEQLIVLLHGVGADGEDLLGLAPILGEILPQAVIVGPNAPQRYDMGPFGYQWFPLQDRDPDALVRGVRASAPALDAFLEAELQRYGLKDDRLALFGFSQGTMMALHVGLRRRQQPAAVVGFSGALVDPAGLADEIACRPPVLLIHGDADPVVPVQALHATAEILQAVGVPVERDVRPGLGHGIDPDGLAKAAAFLQAVFAGAAAQP